MGREERAVADSFSTVFGDRRGHRSSDLDRYIGSVGREELSRLQGLVTDGDYQPAVDILEICRQGLILNDGPATALVVPA